MKTISALTIIILLSSCYNHEFPEDPAPDPNNSHNVKLLRPSSPQIQYKATFNYSTCTPKWFSHPSIYITHTNSSLQLRSTSQCLKRPSQLRYTDIDDFFVYDRNPRFTIKTRNGISTMTIPISRIIECVDRVELTLDLDNNCSTSIQ